MIVKKIINIPENSVAEKCVIGFPGRNVRAGLMEEFFEYTQVNNVLSIFIEPKDLEWYRQPKGAHDEAEAVEDLPKTQKVINDLLKFIHSNYKIKSENIFLFGFSAGAVIILNYLGNTNKNFAGAACFGGAILDHKNYKKCKTKTPIVIQHNLDDECFSYEERLIPMKNALIKGNYNVEFEIRKEGNHSLCLDDVKLLRSSIINNLL